MANYHTDFLQISPYIRAIATTIDTTGITDENNIFRVNAIKKLFDTDSTNIVSMLTTFAEAAPITFEELWENTKVGIAQHGSDLNRALLLLCRLLGWGYIEAHWRALTSRDMAMISGPELASLAAMQLGLSTDLTERDVGQAIFTRCSLLSKLLLRRFETTVAGGLEKALEAEKSITKRIADWTTHLGEIEGRTEAAEEKISGYEKTIQKYRVQLGFLGLSAAYKEFFRRKRMERNFLLGGMFIVAFIILVTPFGAHYYTQKNASAKLLAELKVEVPPENQQKAGDTTRKENNQISKQTAAKSEQKQLELDISKYHLDNVFKYLPFAITVFLLIYFFRIILVHFNSAQAQLLQLEIKMAACGFIEEYVKFLKENDKPDLSKFEALVFGGIVANMDKVPSTFDGFDQVIKAFKDSRGEGK